jgi:IS5 family transposase
MQKPFVTQAELFVSSSDLEHPALHALDDTEAVLDWSKIEPILSSIYASKTGRPSYPLLTLFRGLLLGVWYRLSDVELSQCLYRDLLFRKFCHLELGGDVPEASTLGRLRNQLVEHDLWERLLGEINRQLEAKNIILTEGRINIIDATPVEAAQSGSGKGKDGQPKRDKQAGWHVKKDSRDKLERFGIADHVQRKGYPLAGRALHAREAQQTALGTRQQAQ